MIFVWLVLGAIACIMFFLYGYLRGMDELTTIMNWGIGYDQGYDDGRDIGYQIGFAKAGGKVDGEENPCNDCERDCTMCGERIEKEEP